MGMMWGQHGDNVETPGTMWGPQRQCGDNEIIKTAITFEGIEIIQFYLKIWDP